MELDIKHSLSIDRIKQQEAKNIAKFISKLLNNKISAQEIYLRIRDAKAYRDPAGHFVRGTVDGLYHPRSHSIFISETTYRKMSAERARHVIRHELTHAASFSKMYPDYFRMGLLFFHTKNEKSYLSILDEAVTELLALSLDAIKGKAVDYNYYSEERKILMEISRILNLKTIKIDTYELPIEAVYDYILGTSIFLGKLEELDEKTYKAIINAQAPL